MISTNMIRSIFTSFSLLGQISSCADLLLTLFPNSNIDLLSSFFAVNLTPIFEAVSLAPLRNGRLIFLTALFALRSVLRLASVASLWTTLIGAPLKSALFDANSSTNDRQRVTLLGALCLSSGLTILASVRCQGRKSNETETE